MRKEIQADELANILAREGRGKCLTWYEIIHNLLHCTSGGETLFPKEGERQSWYGGSTVFYIADFADDYKHHELTQCKLRKFYVEE